MPVTARLLRKFYERFGDDVANELVDWMNQVDLSYRAEFRDLFETHFSRFDAKLEQRLAEEVGKLRIEMGEMKAELHAEIGGLRGEIASTRQEMSAQLAGLRADLLKWMFLFWTATALAVIGLH